MAGGNGVVMRIMPHVIKNEEDIEYIMKQVLLNGMYTHGHPRALVGAMLYAYSLAYIFSLETTLEYGELIEELINKNIEVLNLNTKVLSEFCNENVIDISRFIL